MLRCHVSPVVALRGRGVVCGLCGGVGIVFTFGKVADDLFSGLEDVAQETIGFVFEAVHRLEHTPRCEERAQCRVAIVILIEV